ncbi:MAG: PIN domain-containing protein [Limnobacter sp.]|uniref:PIN domain-containing protein n=1 Tax=Limnobacter sp. TaxID=2003368 RepID=UPI0032EB8E40
MPKVKRTAPPLHLVVVDTNILWDKDKKLPVSAAFDEFWNRNSPRIPMSLRVPEVVFGELHFQQTTSAVKTLSNITEGFVEISGITNATYSHKFNESKIKSQVKIKLERWLHGHAGTVEYTPIANIDWAAVVESAVWRQPPFTFDAKDKNNEKGFRDAVILETLVQLGKTADPNNTVIFVCNDYLLRTTSEHRLKTYKNYLAFESLADFEAYVNLTQQKLTNVFVKSIQGHARKKFYVKGDANCIYNRLAVREIIHKDFSDALKLQDPSAMPMGLLGTVISPSDWKVARKVLLIRSTQFARLEGERGFHWVSGVDVLLLFQRESSGPSTGILPLQRLQRVAFSVNWKANVKTDGRFHDTEILSIELVETESRDATTENIEEWRLGS